MTIMLEHNTNKVARRGRWVGAHELLEHAVAALVPGATVEHSRQRRWASATFIGARHFMTLALSGDFPSGLAKRLDTHEFEVPGHIVADICLVEHRNNAAGWEIEIEALTVEAV